ncbi:MAG: hypothetical protein MZU95_01290 [Desulfomicrobium escambiense]|nr:hypothetical protein [Desulfomicrobium escambiense]
MSVGRGRRRPTPPWSSMTFVAAGQPPRGELVTAIGARRELRRRRRRRIARSRSSVDGHRVDARRVSLGAGRGRRRSTFAPFVVGGQRRAGHGQARARTLCRPTMSFHAVVDGRRPRARC